MDLTDNQPDGTDKLQTDHLLKRGDEVFVDITYPFENGDSAFKDVLRGKELKYAPLVQELRHKNHAIVFSDDTRHPHFVFNTLIFVQNS